MRRARLRGVALAVLATAGAAFVCAAACGDEPEPLPQGALISSGYPPIVPDLDVKGAAALEDWIARVTAAAAARGDAGRRGELYLGAAEAVRTLERGAERSHDYLRQALAALPSRDALAALARLELFELALDEAAPPGTRATGATAWAFTEWSPPVDASPLVASRWDLAQREIRARYPPAMLRHALLEGNLELACKWAHSMAEAPNPRWSEGPAGLWEQAAILAHRLGWTEVARRDARLAAEQATDPEVQARLAFWRLHLEHGLLSPDGLLRANEAAPKAGYLEQLDVVLRGLAGNPRVGPFLLSAASSALHGRDYATALAVYRRALSDPVFTQAAWRQPAYWAGLLPAVTAALALERFDEAEELLSAIERIAGEPVPEAAPFRAEIKLKRVQAAERASAPPPKPPQPEPPGPEEVPRPERLPREPGELRLPDTERPEAAREGPAPEGEAEGPAGRSPWAWILALLAGVALVLAVVLLRRRP